MGAVRALCYQGTLITIYQVGCACATTPVALGYQRGENSGGKPGAPEDDCAPRDSRVAVGLLLIALVVLHVQGHLAGLAVKACFMPELGGDTREGGHN